MEIDLIGESIKFMVLGMLVVFAFLVIMVQVMKLQAKIINKFFPEKVPEVAPASSSAANVTASNATQEAHHVAAITAAVAEFRKKS